ncbi:MAG: hypothetical protein ABR500_10000 [Dermatophilaceae bacterium]|nr:hypothetical protein [Intrasporangiaceae bacterium]
MTSVSAAGALAIALVLPGETASATASDVTSTDRTATDLASALLDQRAEQQVSRSARAAIAPAIALQAPAVAAPVAAPSFGALRFTAVEKPPPPPPAPKPAAAPSSSPSGGSSGSGSSSGSSSAPRSSGGSGFDWDAAYACSCARGLTQNSLRVLAAVKYSFPGMTNIGGVRPDSMPDHPSGRALDFMTSDRGYGDAIANLVISRAGELNVDYIIWRQRIWMPSSGWKMMSDRGSFTANHMDHVHVSVK